MTSGDHADRCPYPAADPPVPVHLITTDPHPCPYLPNRQAITRAFYVDEMDGDLYHQFMDRSFRRSGKVIYQPICRGCRACIPIRVPVADFRPTKSQRRCWRQNQDLSVEFAQPAATDEKYQLYQRYQAGWHAKGESPETPANFKDFLYASPVQTLEFCYRDPNGKLLAVGICDLCTQSLSSVYFYFDPAESRRGLGTFGALTELRFALNNKINHYYLGYWVLHSATMSYKLNFRPNQLLGTDNKWRGSTKP